MGASPFRGELLRKFSLPWYFTIIPYPPSLSLTLFQHFFDSQSPLFLGVRLSHNFYFYLFLQDYTQTPPAQELKARDLHDQEWHFRHIYRGM
jgi:hypothetical protein